MKKIIFVLFILVSSLSITTYCQSTSSRNISGTINGMTFSGTLRYKPDCYLGNPYIAVTIDNIRINSYKYQGETYSEREIPGFAFPLSIGTGYIKVKAEFIYGVNSRIYINPTHISIRNGISNDGLINAFMDDHFSWANEDKVKELIKSHDLNCKDWHNKLGRLDRIEVIDGGLDGMQYKLNDAIELKQKNEKYSSLLKKGDELMNSGDYEEAIEIFSEAKYLKDDWSEAEKRINNAQLSLKKAENKEKFEENLTRARETAQNEEYEKAFNLLIQASKFASSDYETSIINAEKREFENLIKEKEENELALKNAKVDEESLAVKASEKESIINKEREKVVEKSSSVANKEKTEKEIQEEIDYYQGRRETKKAMEEERKKKQTAAINAVTESVGYAFSSILSSDFQYIRFSYGLRELQGEYVGEFNSIRSPVTVKTIEAGYGFGKLGVFIGGGLPSAELYSPESKGGGMTGFGGLEYSLFKRDWGIDFGINIESGYGKINHIQTHNIEPMTDSSLSFFYSAGVQLTILKYIFVSYNYGVHNTKRERLYKGEITPLTDGKIKDNFSKIGLGLKFDYWY